MKKMLGCLVALVLLGVGFAEEIWVDGEKVTVEAKDCRGEEFVLLESYAGYADVSDIAIFPAIGDASTLAVAVYLGHPCLQDSRKDSVPLSLELTLPKGIEADGSPMCYFAPEGASEYQEVTSDAKFACRANKTPLGKLALATRDLPGGGAFVVRVPIRFTGEILASASYNDGTIRFALATPTRRATVALRLPVTYLPTFLYFDKVQFLESDIRIEAAIAPNGKAGQIVVDYAPSTVENPLPNIATFTTTAPFDIAATWEDVPLTISLPPIEIDGYAWRLRFVTEDGQEYTGQMQFTNVPAQPAATKPND